METMVSKQFRNRSNTFLNGRSYVRNYGTRFPFICYGPSENMTSIRVRHRLSETFGRTEIYGNTWSKWRHANLWWASFTRVNENDKEPSSCRFSEEINANCPLLWDVFSSAHQKTSSTSSTRVYSFAVRLSYSRIFLLATRLLISFTEDTIYFHSRVLTTFNYNSYPFHFSRNSIWNVVLFSIKPSRLFERVEFFEHETTDNIFRCYIYSLRRH